VTRPWECPSMRWSSGIPPLFRPSESEFEKIEVLNDRSRDNIFFVVCATT